MNIPEFARSAFERYLNDTYGVEWVTKNLGEGELARTVFNGRLMVIRQHPMRRSVDGLEVFHPDQDLLASVEADFLVWCKENNDSKEGTVNEGQG